MDMHEAVNAAKKWIADAYRDEEIANIGLEEIEHEGNRLQGLWRVTIGFVRGKDLHPLVKDIAGYIRSGPRTYKIVTIKEDTGDVISLKNRDVE